MCVTTPVIQPAETEAILSKNSKAVSKKGDSLFIVCSIGKAGHTEALSAGAFLLLNLI